MAILVSVLDKRFHFFMHFVFAAAVAAVCVPLFLRLVRPFSTSLEIPQPFMSTIQPTIIPFPFAHFFIRPLLRFFSSAFVYNVWFYKVLQVYCSIRYTYVEWKWRKIIVERTNQIHSDINGWQRFHERKFINLMSQAVMEQGSKVEQTEAVQK